jgi:UrcA family protein
MSRFHFSSALALAAALAIGGAASAASVDPSEHVVVIVKTSDTDLHTAAGAKTLALRIRNAAAEACGRDVPIAVRFSDGFIRCREATIDRAIKDLNAPLVADALGRSPEVLARSGR